MRRSSIIGPLLLIVLGLLLLWENIGGGPSVLVVLSTQWPWVLVGWGLLRLMELFVQWWQDRPIAPEGLGGGDWFLVFLLCLVGSALHEAPGGLRELTNVPFRGSSARLLGEVYEFPLESLQRQAGNQPALLVETLGGEVIVKAERGSEIRVSGRETVRGETEEDARAAWQSRGLSLEQVGSRFVLRSNMEMLPPNRQPRSYLEIVVPLDCSLEARGRNVRFDVSGLQGQVRLESDQGDAVLADLGGSAELRLDRSREIRARNVAGSLDIQSNRGDNLDIEEVRGQVTATGTFSGSIRMRNIAGSVQIADRRLSFRASAIPGEVSATRGDFLGRGVTGPLRIASEAKDIELEQFTGSAEIDIERRDARIRQDGPQLWPVDVRAGRGKVTLLMPASAQFQLQGSARKGEFTNRTGQQFQEVFVNGRSQISGGASTAPKITVEAARIELETIPGDRR